MNSGFNEAGLSEDFDDDIDGDEDLESSFDDDDDGNDNVGDLSVEINVEELVRKLEATGTDDVVRRREIRRRIEELREQRDTERDLDSTYNINLEDDF